MQGSRCACTTANGREVRSYARKKKIKLLRAHCGVEWRRPFKRLVFSPFFYGASHDNDRWGCRVETAL